MSNDGNGTIKEEAKPKIILAANEALLRLHTQFVLKENNVMIEMVEHITNYHLRKRFAECTEPRVEKYTYIKDLPLEPFEEDVIKILSVYNSFGHPLPLNDEGDPRSVFTPQSTVLQVPHTSAFNSLSLVYQAKHVPLVHTEDEQPIELPDVLYGAFRSYIAYKVFSSMGTQDSTAKAMEHEAFYQSIVDETIDRDSVNTSVSESNNKFGKRGFV